MKMAKKQTDDNSQLSIPNSQLLSEVRGLIDGARQRAAAAVNAELTMLYWQVGQRINVEILQGERADYGQQIVVQLALKLTDAYGKGWSSRQLRYCVQFFTAFPNQEIVNTLCAKLS